MGDGESSAFLIIAEGDEGTFELSVIGIAGNAHFDRELADTDEVFGGSEGEFRGVLFLAEVVGSPQAVHVHFAVSVAASDGIIVFGFPAVHIRVKDVFAVQAGEGFELAIDGGTGIHIGHDVHTGAEGEFVVFFFIGFENIGVSRHVLYAEFGDDGKISRFLFQFGNPYAQACQFVCIFGGEFLHGCFLGIAEVFFLHEAGDDLGQFVAAHILVPAEGAVRISVDHIFFRQLGNGFVGPGRFIHVCKGIGCGNGPCCTGHNGCGCDFQKAVLHFSLLLSLRSY